MIPESPLDEAWYDDKKQKVRTLVVMLVELVFFAGILCCIFISVMQFPGKNVTFYYIDFIKYCVLLIAVLRWNSLAKAYDQDKKQKEFVLPESLKTLRNVMYIAGIWNIVESLGTIFFFSAISVVIPPEHQEQINLNKFYILIGIICICYRVVTTQSMNKINNI